MANSHLGQDVANKRERNFIPFNKLQICVVTVLLLTSTPLTAARIVKGSFRRNKNSPLTHYCAGGKTYIKRRVRAVVSEQ